MPDIAQRIKDKIEKIGTPLKEWDISIYRGILTGYNEAFIIDKAKRDELIQKSPNSAEIIRPILRGRDIKKYTYEFAELYLIYVPWHFPLHTDPSIKGASEKAEKEFEKQYPAIYEHLLGYKEQLSARNKAETGIRYEWYALQRWGADYWEDFSLPKIIYPNMTKFLPFVYDEKGIFTNQKCFILISKTISLKYLLGILNSEISFYWMLNNCPELQGGTRELSKIFFENIPIPETIGNTKKNKITALVDEIIDSKKQGLSSKDLEIEIDLLIYELYGFSNEEIKFVKKQI